MTISTDTNPHNDEKISYLDGYLYLLEEMEFKLHEIEFIDPEESQDVKDELRKDYPVAFPLVLELEKEMGFTFTEMQRDIILAKWGLKN